MIRDGCGQNESGSQLLDSFLLSFFPFLSFLSMAHVFHREFYEPEHDRRVLQQRAQILYESQDLFLEIYYDEEHDFPVVEYVENFTGNQNYNGNQAIRWYSIWSLEHATPTYRDILDTMGVMGVQVRSSCGCCSAADLLAQRVGAEQRFYQMTLYPIGAEMPTEALLPVQHTLGAAQEVQEVQEEVVPSLGLRRTDSAYDYFGISGEDPYASPGKGYDYFGVVSSLTKAWDGSADS
jgi:hypothetical protein